MNIEKMQLKGQLAELKKNYKNLDTEAAGLIILVRSLLNPYEDDITKLEVEKAVISMKRLNSLVLEMQTLKAKIQKLEEHFE